MAQEKVNVKVELSRMKRGTEISINGYSIKKVGTTWNVKKGDFYNRSFTEDRLPKLIEKLETPIDPKQVKIDNRKAKKANRLAAKLVSKNQKAAKKTQKLQAIAIKKEQQVNAKAAKKQQKLQARASKKVKPAKAVKKLKASVKKVQVAQVAQVAKQASVRLSQVGDVAAKLSQDVQKVEKAFKRNKLLAEFLNLVSQAVAYFMWFVFFFTEELDKVLGENALYAVIGSGVVAILVHLLYSRQLGRRHRIVNIFVGLIYLVLVSGAGILYYGPLSHQALDLNDLLPSLEIAVQQPEVISLVAFMFIKWVSLFVAVKK